MNGATTPLEIAAAVRDRYLQQGVQEIFWYSQQVDRRGQPVVLKARWPAETHSPVRSQPTKSTVSRVTSSTRAQDGNEDDDEDDDAMSDEDNVGDEAPDAATDDEGDDEDDEEREEDEAEAADAHDYELEDDFE